MAVPASKSCATNQPRPNPGGEQPEVGRRDAGQAQRADDDEDEDEGAHGAEDVGQGPYVPTRQSSST
jgi:hypothetical protein